MHVEHKFEEKHLSERKIEKKIKFKIFLSIPTYKKKPFMANFKISRVF